MHMRRQQCGLRIYAHVYIRTRLSRCIAQSLRLPRSNAPARAFCSFYTRFSPLSLSLSLSLSLLRLFVLSRSLSRSEEGSSFPPKTARAVFCFCFFFACTSIRARCFSSLYTYTGMSSFFNPFSRAHAVHTRVYKICIKHFWFCFLFSYFVLFAIRRASIQSIFDLFHLYLLCTFIYRTKIIATTDYYN